jgi:Zn-dependent M28 family amino/carboxypeptidase
VRVKALVDSRYYTGVYPYVTGRLPGTGTEEVLVLGHTSEQGAHDNATGVAAMLEAMGALKQAIASGKLPQPRRSIRILAMGEMYGSMHYVATHPKQMNQTVAALCIDTPAAPYEQAGTEYTFYFNPHAAASFVDAFILKVAGAYYGGDRPFHSKEYTTGTDTYLSDPMIGIPTVWPYSGTGVHTHHNSADRPETVDTRSLGDLTILGATYLYYLAAACDTEGAWLAELALTRGNSRW